MISGLRPLRKEPPCPRVASSAFTWLVRVQVLAQRGALAGLLQVGAPGGPCLPCPQPSGFGRDMSGSFYEE